MLWLWHRTAATALIRPLAWEPPYAEGAALKRKKKAKRQKKKLKIELPYVTAIPLLGIYTDTTIT